METGFFNRKARITTTINPKQDTNCLVNPLLAPIKAPNIRSIMIIISTTFTKSFPSIINYIIFWLKNKAI